MSEEFDNIEDLDEEMEVITMVDDETGEEWSGTYQKLDETGEEIEFVVVDRKEHNGAEYILVVESKDIDDDEAEAAILKVVNESEEDITYSVIEDDDEFEAAAGLFESDDYDVEY